MIELLDETSPRGMLRPLNDEILKWLRAGKQKHCLNISKNIKKENSTWELQIK